MFNTFLNENADSIKDKNDKVADVSEFAKSNGFDYTVFFEQAIEGLAGYRKVEFGSVCKTVVTDDFGPFIVRLSIFIDGISLDQKIIASVTVENDGAPFQTVDYNQLGDLASFYNEVHKAVDLVASVASYISQFTYGDLLVND